MFQKKQEILKTKCLILRPFELSDAKIVSEKAGERAIADTTLNVPYPYHEELAVEWFSTHQPKFEAGELAVYAITFKETGEVIGAIGLTIEKKLKNGELGYWIDKNLWGKGYCTEAAKAIVKYGFTELGLHKISANHLKRNPASGNVMQKLGMKQEGVFKDHVLKWEKYEDVVYYGILKKEWKELFL